MPYEKWNHPVDDPRLWYLDLSHNELTGAVPPGLGAARGLIYLYLESNRLTGGLPGVSRHDVVARAQQNQVSS